MSEEYKENQEMKYPKQPQGDIEEQKEQQLSKKQLRKKEKKEQKQKMWEENRIEIRKQRKERAKERRKEMKEKGEEVPRRKKRNIQDIIKGGNIVIDCDFDDKMNDFETKSLFNQIQLLYGANWKYEHPLEVHCVGINGKMQNYVEKNNQCLNWKLMHFDNTPIEEFMKKDEFKNHQFVYLTAESETVLNELDPNTFYIIGGIVDHNRYKCLCENKSKSLNISSACLPISTDNVIGRKVLTVNQVFEIMGEQFHLHNWTQTLEKILPQRKQQTKKDKKHQDETNDSLIPQQIDDDELSI